MDDKLQRLFSDDIGGNGGQQENVGESPNATPNKKLWISVAKNYIVDTTAGISFYTPIMAASEYFIGGMSSDEVLKSRLSAAVYHSVMRRPLGKFRQWYADMWHADAKSSFMKKFLIDTSVTVILQIPVYSAILYSSGASMEEITKALPAGIAIGASTGRPFGYFLDKWRKVWGTKPTLDE